MVDESRAVNASFPVLPEHHVYSPAVQEADEILPVATASMHGECNLVPYFGLPFLVLVFTGIVTDTLFQSFITEAFSDKGGLDGRTYRFACIVCHGIDNAVVRCPFKFAPDLFRLDVEAGQQRAVLSE